MKLNKKVIECTAVACSLFAMSITAIANPGDATSYIVADAANSENTGLSTNGIAGVSGLLTSYELDAYKTVGDIITVQEADEEVLSAAPEEPQLTPEEQAWQDALMPAVDKSLNVRAEASTEADIVGKLYQGDRATVLERGEAWTYIQSGNVVGYVSNEFSVIGTDALNYAKATCDTVATALTGGLRVRTEKSTEAKIATTLDQGASIVVNTEVGIADGWVAVNYKGNVCYVSEEFVSVEIRTGTGVTLEEEAAQIAEAKKAAALAAQKKSSGTESVQGSSVDASVDDVTLLAALIYCEAGASNYECQLAVGAVVVNRMKSGGYPNSIYGVIYQRGQFTPASSGKLARRLEKGVSSSAYQAAQEALAGMDNTGGCLGFRAASSGHAGTVIGSEVFY